MDIVPSWKNLSVVFLVSLGLLVPSETLVAQSPSNISALVTEFAEGSPILFGADSSKTRLRLSWGGSKPHQWCGSIKVKEGWLRDIQTLGLTADSPGTIRLVDRQILIQQQSAVVYSGFDCEVMGSEDAAIEIELTAIDQPDQKIVETVRLADILATDRSLDLGQQTRLTITRAPGDSLRYLSNRKTMVFEIGEQFDFEVQANQTVLPEGRATLLATLVQSRTETPVLWSEEIPIDIDKRGSSKTTKVSVEVPVIEGVFDIKLELQPDRGLTPFRLGKAQIATRSIQLVALNRNPIRGDRGQSWETVTTIDPTRAAPSPNNFSFSTITRFTQEAGSPRVSSDKVESVWIDQQNAIRLPPGGWQAIELPAETKSSPRLLEINYDGNGPCSIGFSVLQSDSSGQFSSQGFDSGVVVPKTIVTRTDEAALKTHRIQYWSHDGRSILLIANRHPTQWATVGRIRLASGPDRLAARPMLGGLHTRKLMSFFESPGFAERFGVQKHADPEMGQPVDDWLVYYEAVDRLIQQLKAAGKNGAVITVLSDGSGLFPSDSIEPTPRYDTGIFASDGRDPIRKDVVEMMYLMFEREGLWLVPALKFSSTLPAVERFRADTGEVQGFELVNFRGDRPNQVEANLLPIYNPLDVRVQKAITDAVSEFAGRYRRFASFQGVALVCHPTAIMGLSGRRWGYDKATRQRFIGSIESSLKKQPETWKAEQHLLLADRYADWMDWRRLQMSNWYRELHKQISQGAPGIRTLITPIDIFRYPEIESLVTPSLHQKPNLDDVMLRLGFDPKFFNEESGITLLKPIRFAPSHSLASRRTEFGIDHSGKLDRWFNESGSRGAVISHRSTWAHFQQLENSGMFARQELPLMRLQPFSLSEDWNRRRYVEELKSNDSQLLVEGGMAIPNGQESGFHHFMNVYSSLPTKAFQSIPSAIEPEKEHPVAVRQLRVGDEHYFYAANDSPWPVEVRLAATEAVPLNLEMFNEESEFTMADENTTVTVRLAPFGILGGRAIGGEFVFNQFSYQLPAEAAQDLKQHYFKLRAKLISASQSQVLPVLQNPDLDAGADGLPAGWTVSEPGNFSVDTDPVSGGSVLNLKSAGENVWIRSNEFQAPETGRLSISVWLRAADPDGQPPLRISVEGTSQEGAYYRFGSIGSLAADKEVNRIGPKWKRFAVHFDDLPTRDLARLRIGFDLMGAGEIEIERVEVYDRWFDENDVKAVTQLLAGVGPLLANTESLERCRNVLGGYWPTFLDNSFEQQDSSRPAEKTAVQPAPSFSDGASEAKQKTRRLNPPKWFQFR